MIGFIKNNNRECPAIFCDTCGEPIFRKGVALAVWNAEKEVKIVHKGKCDIEKQLKSQELIQYLEDLLFNSKSEEVDYGRLS